MKSLNILKEKGKREREVKVAKISQNNKGQGSRTISINTSRESSGNRQALNSAIKGINERKMPFSQTPQNQNQLLNHMQHVSQAKSSFQEESQSDQIEPKPVEVEVDDMRQARAYQSAQKAITSSLKRYPKPIQHSKRLSKDLSSQKDSLRYSKVKRGVSNQLQRLLDTCQNSRVSQKSVLIDTLANLAPNTNPSSSRCKNSTFDRPDPLKSPKKSSVKVLTCDVADSTNLLRLKQSSFQQTSKHSLVGDQKEKHSRDINSFIWQHLDKKGSKLLVKNKHKKEFQSQGLQKQEQKQQKLILSKINDNFVKKANLMTYPIGRSQPQKCKKNSNAFQSLATQSVDLKKQKRQITQNIKNQNDIIKPNQSILSQNCKDKQQMSDKEKEQKCLITELNTGQSEFITLNSHEQPLKQVEIKDSHYSQNNQVQKTQMNSELLARLSSHQNKPSTESQLYLKKKSDQKQSGILVSRQMNQRRQTTDCKKKRSKVGQKSGSLGKFQQQRLQTQSLHEYLAQSSHNLRKLSNRNSTDAESQQAQSAKSLLDLNHKKSEQLYQPPTLLRESQSICETKIDDILYLIQENTGQAVNRIDKPLESQDFLNKQGNQVSKFYQTQIQKQKKVDSSHTRKIYQQKKFKQNIQMGTQSKKVRSSVKEKQGFKDILQQQDYLIPNSEVRRNSAEIYQNKYEDDEVEIGEIDFKDEVNIRDQRVKNNQINTSNSQFQEISKHQESSQNQDMRSRHESRVFSEQFEINSMPQTEFKVRPNQLGSSFTNCLFYDPTQVKSQQVLSPKQSDVDSQIYQVQANFGKQIRRHAGSLGSIKLAKNTQGKLSGQGGKFVPNVSKIDKHNSILNIRKDISVCQNIKKKSKRQNPYNQIGEKQQIYRENELQSPKKKAKLRPVSELNIHNLDSHLSSLAYGTSNSELSVANENSYTNSEGQKHQQQGLQIQNEISDTSESYPRGNQKQTTYEPPSSLNYASLQALKFPISRANLHNQAAIQFRPDIHLNYNSEIAKRSKSHFSNPTSICESQINSIVSQDSSLKNTNLIKNVGLFKDGQSRDSFTSRKHNSTKSDQFILYNQYSNAEQKKAQNIRTKISQKTSFQTESKDNLRSRFVGYKKSINQKNKQQTKILEKKRLNQDFQRQTLDNLKKLAETKLLEQPQMSFLAMSNQILTSGLNKLNKTTKNYDCKNFINSLNKESQKQTQKVKHRQNNAIRDIVQIYQGKNASGQHKRIQNFDANKAESDICYNKGIDKNDLVQNSKLTQSNSEQFLDKISTLKSLQKTKSIQKNKLSSSAESFSCVIPSETNNFDNQKSDVLQNDNQKPHVNNSRQPGALTKTVSQNRLKKKSSIAPRSFKINTFFPNPNPDPTHSQIGTIINTIESQNCDTNLQARKQSKRELLPQHLGHRREITINSKQSMESKQKTNNSSSIDSLSPYKKGDFGSFKAGKNQNLKQIGQTSNQSELKFSQGQNLDQNVYDMIENSDNLNSSQKDCLNKIYATNDSGCNLEQKISFIKHFDKPKKFQTRPQSILQIEQNQSMKDVKQPKIDELGHQLQQIPKASRLSIPVTIQNVDKEESLAYQKAPKGKRRSQKKIGQNGNQEAVVNQFKNHNEITIASKGKRSGNSKIKMLNSNNSQILTQEKANSVLIPSVSQNQIHKSSKNRQQILKEQEKSSIAIIKDSRTALDRMDQMDYDSEEFQPVVVENIEPEPSKKLSFILGDQRKDAHSLINKLDAQRDGSLIAQAFSEHEKSEKNRQSVISAERAASFLMPSELCDVQSKKLSIISQGNNQNPSFVQQLNVIEERFETQDSTASDANLSPRSKIVSKLKKKIRLSFLQKGVPPETQIENYKIGKVLGKGAFGKVNLAIHRLGNKFVALKSINKQYMTKAESKNKVMQEFNMLRRTRHQNIVRLYESFETPQHIVFVMEVCGGGDLLTYVRKRRKLKEPIARHLFAQIVSGMNYCHRKNVLHRDIKLDNILLNSQGNVKICDFGVSKLVKNGETMKEQCGTPAYIAPEVFENKGYIGYASDVWSAGVVLFAMLYGAVPFKATNMTDLYRQVLQSSPTYKTDISDEAISLLKAILTRNPKERLTCDQIINHPWMKKFGLKNVNQTDPKIFTQVEKQAIVSEFEYYTSKCEKPILEQRNNLLNLDNHQNQTDPFAEQMLVTTQNSILRNITSKSIILAPFNSTKSNILPLIQLDEIQSQIADKNCLRFNARVKEVDRQYELNNNAELDNGVYHQSEVSQQSQVKKSSNGYLGNTKVDLTVCNSRSLQFQSVSHNGRSASIATSFNREQLTSQLNELAQLSNHSSYNHPEKLTADLIGVETPDTFLEKSPINILKMESSLQQSVEQQKCRGETKKKTEGAGLSEWRQLEQQMITDLRKEENNLQSIESPPRDQYRRKQEKEPIESALVTESEHEVTIQDKKPQFVKPAILSDDLRFEIVQIGLFDEAQEAERLNNVGIQAKIEENSKEASNFDLKIISKIEECCYPKFYIVKSLQNDDLNHVTTQYQLLQRNHEY